jgi:protein disulfide-isomerase
MRSIRSVVIAAFLAAATAQAARAGDQIPWQPTVEAAQQIAAKTNRLVLLHFWSTSCQPCLRLDHEVFSRAEVAKALEPNFVMVKLKWEDAPGTARLYGVSSVPTDVIILPNGRLVSQMQSPPSANQYVAQMNQAAEGHRELMKRAVAQAPAGAAAPPAQATAQGGAVPQGPNANAPYAEYFNQQAGAPQGSSPPPAAYAQAPPHAAYAQAPPQMAGAGGPAVQSQMQTAAPYQSAPVATMPASYRPELPPPPQVPPGSPPLGLDGYCPVTLVERQQWAMGAAAYGAIHRGRTYLFLGPAEAKKFLANPELYSPVHAGFDPVLALDNQALVPGRREFGVYSDNRVYLFADEASRRKFEQNPQRYSAESLQAATGAPLTR